MKAVKYILMVLVMVFLLPAGCLWIVGEGFRSRSLVVAWTDFMKNFCSSRGISALATAISLILYWEFTKAIIALCAR